MANFQVDANNRFVLGKYQTLRPFSSFLPGIAGPFGIPMWVFYINRGQCIAGFGVENKDNGIMEFQPANKAYQSTSLLGFRTFLKLSRGGQAQTFYEPFSRHPDAEQKMFVGANDLVIEDVNSKLGLTTTVKYFSIPNEPFAALVRQVTFTNTGSGALAVEVLDGLPQVIPFGVNEWCTKHMSRTVEAWMEVFNMKEKVPYYRVRASVADKAEVETITAGHFAVCFIENGGKVERLPALVDPAVIFGSDTTFGTPEGFTTGSLSALQQANQITCGRTPSGFFGHAGSIAAGQGVTLNTVWGHVGSEDVLNRYIGQLTNTSYLENAHKAAIALAQQISDPIETKTANPLFDAYCRQNLLDNILRGGWPMLLGDPQNPHVYALYSRKHGDLERDYNAYVIAPEPYSQGETSYRDVNQNRRDNVCFCPKQGDVDVRMFLALIQSDGYNPRTVKGGVFTLKPEQRAAVVKLVKSGDAKGVEDILSKPFTPGNVLKHIFNTNSTLSVDYSEFLTQALKGAEQHWQASFTEGYWIDHWEYNLDLVESYLKIYPDRHNELFFLGPKIPFFDSPAIVQPRSKKYVEVRPGVARQLGSLVEDRDKEHLIASRGLEGIWTRTQNGKGDIYKVSVFAKMALLTLIKFSTLDAYGMGIEMEAGRPGWDDALNGAPALFGSGMSESFELKRWITALRRIIATNNTLPNKASSVQFPTEFADLLNELATQLKTYKESPAGDARDFKYWDAVRTALEKYREKTKMGFDGKETEVTLASLDATLAAAEAKSAEGIARALALNNGIPPTYFTFRVEYTPLGEKDSQGRPFVKVTKFICDVLPLFLEGPVRAFKVQPDVDSARKMYEKVRGSDLFDKKIKMYKLNASLLSQPFDIGRVRAFPPGWLENESIWLHMEYKYLLETIKVGLYKEFYTDIQTMLIPFLDPKLYGRSTLENSSFLASSAYADPALHGSGYVARLSGSTAEFLSIWLLMMCGKHPFDLKDGKLVLSLRPAVAESFFPTDGKISFRFLANCTVTYHNPKRTNTWEILPKRYVLTGTDGSTSEVTGDSVPLPQAQQVRDGKIAKIDVHF